MRPSLRRFKREAGYRWWDRRIPDPGVRTMIFEGRPGEGKTLLLTREAIALMRAGYDVSSNYAIEDVVTGARSERVVDWVDMFRQSVRALEVGRPRVFVLSEIHLWAGSRDTQLTPRWWLALMALRRHYGIALLGDTQSLTRVEIVLRELVDQIVQVRRPLWIRWLERVTGRAIPLRLIQLMDASELELGRDHYQSMGNARPTLIPWWAYHSYDTREMVRPEQYRKDELIESEIEELTRQADELVRPAGFVTFDAWVNSRVAGAVSPDVSVPASEE